jgi:polyisoprenyl-teichoic acid--peptidoglycan teichoic acid transferase
MKKLTYHIINLIIVLLFSLTTWFNPLIFTNLKYVLIVAGIFISMGLFIRFVKFKRILNVHKVLLVFALLISSLNIWITRSVDDILNPIDLETTQLSVYVLKENASLTMNESLVLGVSLDIDPTIYESFTLHIENEFDFIIRPSQEAFDQDLIDALYDKSLQGILLDVANLAFLEDEELDEFLDKTVIIYTFEKSTVVTPREPIVDDFESNAIVIYISGIDHLGELGWRSRSDVNQLAIVNPDTRTISLVSIPRDTYIPTTCLNNKNDKLAHAAVRGIECSISTIENYLNVPIDYYVRLNFSSFISIFDIIGPVEVYSHYTFNANGFSYVKGLNTMNTAMALSFARARKQVPGGDQTRGLHQQEIIKGVFKKVTSPSQFGNIQTLINSTRRFVNTNLSSSSITELLDLHVSSTRAWQMDSYVLRGENASRPMPNDPNRFYSVVLHDEAQLLEYIELIKDLRRIPE